MVADALEVPAINDFPSGSFFSTYMYSLATLSNMKDASLHISVQRDFRDRFLSVYRGAGQSRRTGDP